MNNIKVTNIEFLGCLLPNSGCSVTPFCSTSYVCSDDLPDEVNKNIWEEINKGRSVIPVMLTVQVSITDRNITDDVADEVMSVARRALKSVEYVNEADRGAISACRLAGNDKPFISVVKVSPLSVIEALTSGYPYHVRVIGFLTREK